MAGGSFANLITSDYVEKYLEKHLQIWNALCFCTCERNVFMLMKILWSNHASDCEAPVDNNAHDTPEQLRRAFMRR